jgi:outer membrane protein assembly factor BamB
VSRAALVAMVALTASAPAANHLFNAQRTGYTPEEFKPPYHRVWTHRFQHKPRPAWREPAWETQRIDFDYAYAVAAGNGLVYVASSSDHALHALDIDSGETRWRFFTEGPVRLAPCVANGKVYASSDDGWVYCLDGKTGGFVWRYRPSGIPDERLVGNEQVISRWPARSGVLVEAGRAYTTFGMWSPEGVAVVCLDAGTGKPIWKNDGCGTHYMTQPHFEAMGGVSPQGYLALDDGVLAVTCGRAPPAFFAAATGEFLYHESEGLFPGGAWTMISGGLAFTPCELLQKPNPEAPVGDEADVSPFACLVGLRARTGEEVFHLRGALRGVITDDNVLNLLGPKTLLSVRLADVLKAAPAGQARIGSSEGQFVEAAKHAQWKTPADRIYELVQAGSTLIAGGRNTLTCYDASNGHKTWETKVDGGARELLIVGDSLLVSTTEGEVHCFRRGASEDGGPRVVGHIQPRAVPSGGYGLLLGDAGVSRLAGSANDSELTWYWAAGDRDTGETRRKLADAGLYGTRVAIHNVGADPLPYADYSMSMVEFRAQSAEDLNQVDASEVRRVLRPCGGAAVIQCPGALRDQVTKWLAEGGIPQGEIHVEDVGIGVIRGPLRGVGAWTHQYGDAGRSGASRDTRVRLPLKVLWFGSVGPADIVSRHYRTPAPLAIDGHLFIPGLNYVHAVDAYNGRILWERELPGVGRWPAAYLGGSVAADAVSVLALQGDRCLRLDRATGETMRCYETPEKRDGMIWEYLAVTENCVIGTLGNPNVKKSWWSQAYPENVLVFALDKETGAIKWTCEPVNTVDSNAIAIEGDRLFLIDGLARYEIFNRPKPNKNGFVPKRRRLYDARGSDKPRELVAIDLASGKVLWKTHEVGAGQNNLAVSEGVVVASSPMSTGNMVKLTGPGLCAFSAQNGKLLWKIDNRISNPVLTDGTVYMGNTRELRTGKQVFRRDPLSGLEVPFTIGGGGGCARFSGSPNLLMKRSGSLGFVDLRQRSGLYHYPNVRASCWVNMIPACGLVLVPEGSSSCPCAYNYKTSIAFMPAERNNHWGLYGGKQVKKAPVRDLRLNFGAPGDKPDEDGNIWFAYPRPSTTGPRGAGGMGTQKIMALPVEIVGDAGAPVTHRRNPDWRDVGDTDRPWLYSCSLSGPLLLRVRLAPAGAGERNYRVTAYFADGGGGRERYDMKLQGKAAAGSSTVKVGDTLRIEFVPRGRNPGEICGLHIQVVE